MELIFAVVHLGRATLEAVVKAGGKQRRITIRWHEKENFSIPPATWYDQVKGEVEYQLEQEGLQRRGRDPILTK